MHLEGLLSFFFFMFLSTEKNFILQHMSCKITVVSLQMPGNIHIYAFST